MTFEILLVTGCVLGVLSIVSIVTARLDNRTPRVAALVVVTAGGLILAASAVSGDGLQLTDVPHAFVTIIAAILN